MKSCRVHKDGILIADDVSIADRYLERLIGLLKHQSLDENEGLLINPCKQVHTIGMKYSIDVLFLSKDNKVLHFENSLPPGKISRYIKNAATVLELKAGKIIEYDLKRFDYICVEK